MALALELRMSTPTQITITPDRLAEKPIFGVRTPGDGDLTAAQAIDIVNPLNHIPFVSQVYEAATGNTASGAARIIGGALLGGPIGMLAGIITTIFETETGQGPLGALASAVTGGSETTQVASTAKAAGAYQTAAVTAAPAQEILPPVTASADAIKAERVAARVQDAQMQMASAISDVGSVPLSAATTADQQKQREEDRAILALFGQEQQSAHKSYQRAQMLPYLNDVSTSMVL